MSRQKYGKSNIPSGTDAVFLAAGILAVFIAFFRMGMLLDFHSSRPFIEMITAAAGDFTKLSTPPAHYIMSPTAWLAGLMGAGLAGGGYMYMVLTRKKYRPGEEHGSSRYADISREAADLRDEEESRNIILSREMRLSMNTGKHYRNLNVTVFGGSGAGKTRTFVKPNILQMECNYVVTDPKGSLISETGNAFRQNGYAIKVLNLVDMDKSMRYNPFAYFRSPNDVLKFVNSLIENTNKQKEASGADEFWEKAETALLTSLCYFLLAVGKKSEQNIPTMMNLIQLADASEENGYRSVLDDMFDSLDEENKMEEQAFGKDFSRDSYGVLAVREYRLYKKAAGKTAKSILISIGVRMSIFDVPAFRDLLVTDELDLESIGKPHTGKDGKPVKTILFCIVSDNDSTFTFMASILYQQLFELLYHIADNRPDNRLPVHTAFVLDEIANQPQIPDFDKKIATMRSRGISSYIILQEVTKFKAVYPKTWETILGNCDTALFLGANFTAQSTTKYISEIVGTTTIDYRSVSMSRGATGGWSESNQLIQRALLDPAEIGRLPIDECLVLVRGKHVFRDRKYDLMDHVNTKLTADADRSNRFEESVEETFMADQELVAEIADERIEDGFFSEMNSDTRRKAALKGVLQVNITG